MGADLQKVKQQGKKPHFERSDKLLSLLQVRVLPQ